MAHASLAALAGRRVLTPGVVGLAVALIVAWPFLLPGGVDAGDVRGTAGERGEPVASAALDPGPRLAARRQATWIGLGLFLFPAYVYRAAATGRRWRERDRLWLGARPVARGGVVAAAWLGTWLAGVALALPVAFVAERAAAGGGLERRLVRELAAPAALLSQPGARVAWELAGERGDLAPPRLLSIALAAAPGSGPTARVVASARRVGDAPGANGANGTTSAEVRVAGRTTFEVPLPPGAGSLDVALERPGEGCAVVLLPDAVRLVEPRASAFVAPLLARVALLLAVWSALGIALGAWMGTGLATVLALVLLLPASSTRAAALAWPDAGVARSLADLGRGLAPGAVDAGTLGAAAAAVVLALAAAVAGLAREASE